MKNLILVFILFAGLSVSAQTVKTNDKGEIVQVIETEFPISVKSVDSQIIALETAVKDLQSKIEKLKAVRNEVEKLKRKNKFSNF
jgi:peptidoglycan hydrolase CwlO-like protein